MDLTGHALIGIALARDCDKAFIVRHSLLPWYLFDASVLGGRVLRQVPPTAIIVAKEVRTAAAMGAFPFLVGPDGGRDHG